MDHIRIAPCGMNCNLCMRFMRLIHNVPREKGPSCAGGKRTFA